MSKENIAKPVLPVGNEEAFSPMAGETKSGVDGAKIDMEDMPSLNNLDDDGDIIQPVNEDVDDNIVTIDGTDFTLDEEGNALNEAGEIVYNYDELDLQNESDDNEFFEIDGVQFTINEDGEGVDADGKVIYTAEELDEYETDESVETEVEIDGVVYELDEEGNAINENGEVEFTVDELNEFSEIPNDIIDVTTLMQTSNIVPYDTDGNPLEYTNDDTGIRSYIEDVYEAGGIDRAQQLIDARNSQYPLIGLVSDYIIANGSLDGFNEHSFEERTINADSDEAVLTTAIREARALKGDSETEIARLITWAKSDNKLYEIASESQAYIDEVSSSKREELAQQAAIRQERQEAADIKYQQTLENYLETGVVEVDGQEVVIPKILEVADETGRITTVDRRELLSYGTEMIQWDMGDGTTQVATRYQMDKFMANQNNTPAKDLINMLKMFTGQNNIIDESMIQTREAERITKRLSTKRNKNSRQSNNNNNAGKIILPGGFN